MAPPPRIELEFRVNVQLATRGLAVEAKIAPPP
jgi:hypothetical protein